MTIQLVVFDCDGVLLDTRKSARNYYDALFKEVQAPLLTDMQFKSAFMSTVEEAIQNFISDPQKKKAANDLQKNFDSTPFLDNIEIAPTTIPFLLFLRQFVKTAILTNRSYSMKSLIDRWSLHNYFDMIISALDVQYPKPHPEGLEKILAAFSIAPKNALFVGDSPSDQKAANAAHIPFVAFQKPDLNADYYIDELPQLADILQLPV